MISLDNDDESVIVNHGPASRKKIGAMALYECKPWAKIEKKDMTPLFSPDYRDCDIKCWKDDIKCCFELGVLKWDLN